VGHAQEYREVITFSVNSRGNSVPQFQNRDHFHKIPKHRNAFGLQRIKATCAALYWSGMHAERLAD
jgi:hypothetical protein